MNGEEHIPDGENLAGSRRELELAYLKGLPSCKWDDSWLPGVQLADQIERAVREFKLIDPFQGAKGSPSNKLRPAGYELSVGKVYSINGEIRSLSDDLGCNQILIKPFDVVIIQTLERLNMPEFMIARWNVTVGRAYEGLLWVGAAQVDPGFKGYLCCPIYNLSDRDRILKFGESIAVIDFVGTTPPNKRSREFAIDFTSRKRLLFEEYGPETLRSALVTHVQQRLDTIDASVRSIQDKVHKDLSEVRATVFNSIGIILAAIGALVTALALFVSNEVPKMFSWYSPALLVAFASLVVSLSGVIIATTKSRSVRHILFCLVLIGSIVFLHWYGGRYPVVAPNQGTALRNCTGQSAPCSVNP